MSGINLVPLAPFLLVAWLGVLVFLVLLGLFILAALRTVFGGRRRNHQPEADEVRLMQDINQSLLKLEQRVESLETIMLEAGAPQGAAQSGSRRSQ